MAHPDPDEIYQRHEAEIERLRKLHRSYLQDDDEYTREIQDSVDAQYEVYCKSTDVYLAISRLRDLAPNLFEGPFLGEALREFEKWSRECNWYMQDHLARFSKKPGRPNKQDQTQYIEHPDNLLISAFQNIWAQETKNWPKSVRNPGLGKLTRFGEFLSLCLSGTGISLDTAIRSMR